MALTYPPANPTITNDLTTISRFLNNPTAVNRRLRTLAENRFISDALLVGRVEGSSISYEQSESQHTSKAPEIVAPGSQYPRALPTVGPALMAHVSKWGQEVPLTDEAIGRFRGQAVERTLAKIVNYLVYQIDTISLAIINSQVTQSVPVTAAWDAAGAKPLLDVLRAKAKIRATNQGFDPNVLVVDDYAHAYLMDNVGILTQAAGQLGTSVSVQGELMVIAGLRVMPTSNLPTAGAALVADTNALGALGYERIPSPEFQGDPANGVETAIERNRNRNDEYILRGRRPVVAFVQEPLSACKITGLGTLND
jgi:hypothetical protein